MRRGLTLLLIALLLTAGPTQAEEATDVSGGERPTRASGSVTIELTGGKLTRKAGQPGGKAEVQARLHNSTGRRVLGVRIAAYFDTLDMLPAPDAPWTLREFLLEPPLAPDASATLEFSEDAGAEYVLLRVDYVRYTLAIVVNGRAHNASHELLMEAGTNYIAARELATALGAELKALSSKPKQYELSRPGRAAPILLVFTPGSVEITTGTRPATLARPVLERDGRSWLPLEVCRLLGLTVEYDAEANLLKLD